MNLIRDNLRETAPAKVTTAGDLIYATAANAIARLAFVSNGKILGASGGLPAWITAAWTILSGNTWKTTYTDGSGNVTELAIGANDQVLMSAGTAAAPVWRNQQFKRALLLMGG